MIINNVVKAPDSDFLLTRARQQKGYLEHIHEKYSDMKIVELPMFPYELKGLDRLREVEKVLFSKGQSPRRFLLTSYDQSGKLELAV